MYKILINFAHPSLSHSIINKALLNAVKDIKGITINNLYDNYPDFLIDIKKEQALCNENDIIIFQHPFYWYQPPAIIKEWFDSVLEYSWLKQKSGNPLKNKIIFQTITSGGSEAYQKQHSGFTIFELNYPFLAIANTCEMKWLPPFVVQDAYNNLSKAKIEAYANSYRDLLIALQNENLDLDKAVKEQYLNTNLNQIIRR